MGKLEKMINGQTLGWELSESLNLNFQSTLTKEGT